MTALHTLINTYGTETFVVLMIGYVFICAVVVIDELRLVKVRAERLARNGF